MNGRNTGPVDPKLVVGAASVLLAGIGLLEHFGRLHIDSLMQYLMFLARLTS